MTIFRLTYAALLLALVSCSKPNSEPLNLAGEEEYNTISDAEGKHAEPVTSRFLDEWLDGNHLPKQNYYADAQEAGQDYAYLGYGFSQEADIKPEYQRKRILSS